MKDNDAQAIYDAAVESLAAYDAIRARAAKPAQPAYVAARKQAQAAYDAAMKLAWTTLVAARQQAEAARVVAMEQARAISNCQE